MKNNVLCLLFALFVGACSGGWGEDGNQYYQPNRPKSEKHEATGGIAGAESSGGDSSGGTSSAGAGNSDAGTSNGGAPESEAGASSTGGETQIILL